MKTHSGSFAVSWTVHCIVSVGGGVVDPSKSDGCGAVFCSVNSAVLVDISKYAWINV